MSRPLGKIFTNNTVFTSEGFCLIYFSTRPKLPVLCAIFYISPTECKWLCWGKKNKNKLCGSWSRFWRWYLWSSLVCRSRRCVPEMATLPPTKVGSSHAETKQRLTPRHGVTSARSRLVKERRKTQRDQVQNCGEIPLLNISETLFSAFRQISASIYSPFPSLKWAPLDFLNFVNLCRQWSLTRGLHSGRKQRKTTNNERGS